MANRRRTRRPLNPPRQSDHRVTLRELIPGHHTFHATFIKASACHKTGFCTILLRDVTLGAKQVSDHLWINTGVVADERWLGFSEHSKAEIVACVVPYIHGQPNSVRNPQRVEYTLGDVRSVKRKEHQ